MFTIRIVTKVLLIIYYYSDLVVNELRETRVLSIEFVILTIADVELVTRELFEDLLRS